LNNEIVPRKEIVADMHCMHPDYLNYQLDQSLSNLGLQGIDLMYLHNPSEAQQTKIGKEVFMKRLTESFEFFEQARKEAKLKYYGLATWDAFRVSSDNPAYMNLEDTVRIAEDIGGSDHGFMFIQLPVNLAMPEAMTNFNQTINGEQVIPLKAARELGIGVFSSVPLMQTQLLNYQIPEITGYTPAQVCLEFVRSIPEILAPLIGHKRVEHVEENIGLAKIDCLNVENYRSTFFQ
jgi:aryl-alcohol dehydrogenase-like predicted oxidoreductase